MLGDLTPGKYTLLIDESTLPQNLKSVSGTVQIEIKPGQQTAINFPVLLPVKVKKF
jgi:hypothetical protein